MSKKTENIFFYLLGEIAAKGIPFAFLPYLTRKLGPEEFGELSYALSILAVIMVFISLSQEAATISYYYRKGKKALKYLVVSGFLINLVSSLFFCLLLSFFTKHYTMLAVLASVSVIYSFYLAILQAQVKVKQYICVQILYSLFSAALTFAFLEYSDTNLISKRLESLVIAYTLVSIPFLVFFVRSLRSVQFNRVKIYLMYILTYGLPLILHQLGIYVKGQMDRIFIYQQYSKFELGIYAAGVQIAAILPIFIMAINKAIVPYYYQSLKNNELTIHMIKKYTLLSLPISIFPGVIAFFIPAQLYVWFLGSAYSNSKYYIVMYLLGFGMSLPYSLLVNYFFYHGENFIISKITLIASGCYLILLWFLSAQNIQLIPYALIISNILLLIMLWIKISSEE